MRKTGDACDPDTGSVKCAECQREVCIGCNKKPAAEEPKATATAK